MPVPNTRSIWTVGLYTNQPVLVLRGCELGVCRWSCAETRHTSTQQTINDQCLEEEEEGEDEKESVISVITQQLCY